jgi:hypothetical protein
MATEIGPDGRPAVFEGGVWMSQDRRFRWNGAAWLPVKGPGASPWLMQIGVGLLFLALIGYAVYTMVTTESAFVLGYYVGVILFFAILIAIYRYAGRWGWFGIVVRAGCGVLAVLKVLTLIAHPPPT